MVRRLPPGAPGSFGGSLVDDLDLSAARAAKILGEGVVLLVWLAVRRDFNDNIHITAAGCTKAAPLAAVPFVALAAPVLPDIHAKKDIRGNRLFLEGRMGATYYQLYKSNGSMLPLKIAVRPRLRPLGGPVDEAAGDAAEDVIGRLPDPLGQVHGGLQGRAAASAQARGAGFRLRVCAIVGHFTTLRRTIDVGAGRQAGRRPYSAVPLAL